MDPRVREHAETIVDHSAAVEPGDDVIIRAPRPAEDLVIALHEAIGERNGKPAISWHSGRAHREYLRAVDAEALEPPEHVRAFVENADVYIDVSAPENVHETADVSPETQSAFGQSLSAVQEAQMDIRWVYTAYPSAAGAQKAEMSTAAYEDFVWSAVNRDWGVQRERQAELVSILEAGDEVRIQAGEATDLRMRLGDNPLKNDYGRNNLPGGEVSTAPIPDSVEGVVAFDFPTVVGGREVRDARVTFEDGEVIDFEAATNEAALAGLFETDAGARRLGELGIGLNCGIEQFTHNTLFDEKMGGTLHVALGRAYDHSVAAGNERNESAIHRDMLVDMRTDATLTMDGKVILRDGTFAFEEDF